MTNVGPGLSWEPRWTCDVTTVSPTVTGWAVQFATEVIWALSGRRFGTRQVTLRPCRRQCLGGPWPGLSPWPSYGSGYGTARDWWIEPTCDFCGDLCSCTSLSRIRLPAPVSSVIEVKIDGVVVTGSTYRLDEGRFLTRVDGDAWPTCNDLGRPDTAVGTWSVTAAYGEDVPEGGKWAVGELACEIIRATRGEDCRLPRNVTNIARQGITLAFPNVTALFKDGLTGLYLADMFIISVNPDRLRAPSAVYHVDGDSTYRAG